MLNLVARKDDPARVKPIADRVDGQRPAARDREVRDLQEKLHRAELLIEELRTDRDHWRKVASESWHMGLGGE